ncbi:hypothetical protein C1H46_000222 [Malus baccata]|uniref:Uncharacterized protein n=1 Tax=Malus baccata TaxID=106549 RepID=A0A540NUQ1_MALBA|nr:hypothetical protein C1H46_000222 [Malus baccata]
MDLDSWMSHKQEVCREMYHQLSSNFSWNEQDRGCMEHINRVWGYDLISGSMSSTSTTSLVRHLRQRVGTLPKSFWNGWASMVQKKDKYLANLFQQHPDVPVKKLTPDPEVSLQVLMDGVG